MHYGHVHLKHEIPLAVSALCAYVECMNHQRISLLRRVRGEISLWMMKMRILVSPYFAVSEAYLEFCTVSHHLS